MKNSLDDRITEADGKFYILPDDIANNITPREILLKQGTIPSLLYKGKFKMFVYMMRDNAMKLLELSDERKNGTPELATLN